MGLIKNFIAQVFTGNDWDGSSAAVFFWGVLAAAGVLALPWLIAEVARWGMAAGIFPLKIFG